MSTVERKKRVKKVDTVVVAPAAAEGKGEPKKTRAKKDKPAVVAVVTPDGIVGSLMAEVRPLIAHIPVNM